MKKLLLSGTVLAGMAFAPAAAQAQLSIDLSGFYRGYAVYADNDETTTAASSDDLRQFDLTHDAEIHFTGETTLDNGLTVGFHAEHDLGGSYSSTEDRTKTDEVYVYFQGSWGRVNVGQEDGAGYLLQVAAPSADSNVDGLRTTVQRFNFAVPGAAAVMAGAFTPGQSSILDYDMAQGRYAEKISYLTPKFSGFQAGVSWAPELTDDCAEGDPAAIVGPAGCYANGNQVGNNIFGMNFDDNAGHYEHLVEVAARWDGEFDQVGLSIGGGWGRSNLEAPLGGAGLGTDDRTQWNAGINVTFQQFSLGGAYLFDDNGATGPFDSETFLVGLGWDNGPWHAGASWLNATHEQGVGSSETDIDRITVGGTYTFGPGMTFRGAVAWGELEDGAGAGALDSNLTQVTFGTEINF